MATLHAVAVIVGLFHVAYSINPGMKIRVTQAGLNYAAAQAMNVLAEDVKGQSLTDQKGDSNGKKVGTVEWSLTGIRITSFGKPASRVTVNPGAGITWSAAGASVSVRADWRYSAGLRRRKRGWMGKAWKDIKKTASKAGNVVVKASEKVGTGVVKASKKVGTGVVNAGKWVVKELKHIIKVKDHGSIYVSFSKVRFSLSVRLGKDGRGRPTMSATRCSCYIGDVSLRVSGRAGPLYNVVYKLFRKFIDGPIKKEVQIQLCKSAENAIDVSAANKLAELKLNFNLDMVKLDYRLVSSPVFGRGYLETSHKGEISWKNGNLREQHLEAHPLQSGGGDRMMTVWVSDYVMNSLGTVLQNHGVLAYDLSSNDLRGRDIKAFFYQVRKLYPIHRMGIEMKTTEAPTLNIITNRLTGYFHGLFKYYVQMGNGAKVYLFTTDMKFNATLAPKISKTGRIIAKVVSLIPTIKFTNSKIKGINGAALHRAFSVISELFLIPKLNEIGMKGIEIPNIDDVIFVNPKLTLSDGAIAIATDLKYTPN